MSLRRGVWTVLTIVLLFFVAAATLVAVEVASLRTATDKIRNKYDPALLNTQALLAGYINQETGTRGYVITGQDSFLVPFTTGQAGITRATGRLNSLLSDEPRLLTLLHDATTAGTAWQQAAEPELDARRAGDAQQATALVATGRSKDAFDALRTRLTALQTAVSQRRTAADDTQGRVTETLIIALIVAAAIALAAVIVLVVAARRWVLRPIEALGRALFDVHAGSLDRPVVVDGPSEFRELAQDADEMRQRLVVQIETASRATEGLAQNAPVVLDIRAALQSSGVAAPGLDLHGVVATAEGEIAGDWWDLLDLGPGRQMLIIADVSGHGASAGLLATQLKSVILSAVSLGADPTEVFRLAADHVFRGRPDKFATAVLLDLDLVAGRLAWTNAGHPGPLLMTAAGAVRSLDATGPLLHPIATGWTTESAPFGVGDLLLVFSDGLTEARDAEAGEFGLARIRQAAARGTTSIEVVDAVLADLTAHTGSRRSVDDVALIAARRLGD